MINASEKLKTAGVEQTELEAKKEQISAETSEYNEKGLKELINQAHLEITNEQNRIFESADKRIENTPVLSNLSDEKVAPIKEQFSETIENIKGQITELGNKTQAKIQELETPSSEFVESREREKTREKTMEQFQEKRSNILSNIMTSEVTSNGLDLVPFAGGGKMLVESISGKTLSGRELKGKDRIVHVAIGAGSLALDFTGIGELGKGGIIVGKSVVLVEKLGTKLAERGAVKSAAIFEKTAAFMKKHPEAVSKAEQFAEQKLQDLIKTVKSYRAGERDFVSTEKNKTTPPIENI